jgi:glycosyltransferase involved in cell wall biosynthesis
VRILALNPYHGGSHAAFLQGWSDHSRHDFTVLSLPAHKWKWRMRHAAVTFAERLAAWPTTQTDWDALFCTDMLNLAEFLGLCEPSLRETPACVYFHENQLTYPVRHLDERDLHFAFTNLTSCLAAHRVWFNSAFHRETFLDALDDWLCRMPDFRPRHTTSIIREKSEIRPPGVDSFPRRGPRREGPLRIVWAARWEHDKDPETFFNALRELRQRGGEFRLRVLGQAFADTPACFRYAREEFHAQVDHWGYLPDRRKYDSVLLDSDVIVSTAQHEFFGIAVVEAVAAGCFPLVPRRLAYPDIFGDSADFYHDGTATGLAERLFVQIDRLHSAADLWSGYGTPSELVGKFEWSIVARDMDDACEQLRA